MRKWIALFERAMSRWKTFSSTKSQIINYHLLSHSNNWKMTDSFGENKCKTSMYSVIWRRQSDDDCVTSRRSELNFDGGAPLSRSGVRFFNAENQSTLKSFIRKKCEESEQLPKWLMYLTREKQFGRKTAIVPNMEYKTNIEDILRIPKFVWYCGSIMNRIIKERKR